MLETRTPERVRRISGAARATQPTLRLALENIHDPHNVSAIFRTCDAAGARVVSLIYNIEKLPKIGKKSSASAYKWIERERHENAARCFEEYRERGFRVYVSALREGAKNLYDLDLAKPSLILLGNEHRGASEEAIAAADEVFAIPMYGFVQSLNVSVSAAIILYEAVRQRRKAGMYDEPQLGEKELTELIDRWSEK